MEKYSRFLLILIIFLATAGSATPFRAEDQTNPDSPFSLYKSTRTEKDGLTITADYFTYQIEGDTISELRNQMDTFGKADDAGKTWDAYTEWFIYWNYQETRSEFECTAGPVELSINVRIFVPNWEIPTNADSQVVEAWQSYLLALLKHEEEHKKIVFMRADALYTDLNNVPPHTTCQELAFSVNTVGNNHKDYLYYISTTYDHLTDHGQALGATFP